jgi:hypothetical protein
MGTLLGGGGKREDSAVGCVRLLRLPVFGSRPWMGNTCCRIFASKSARNRDREIHVMIFRSILVSGKTATKTKGFSPPPQDFTSRYANAIMSG